jgi:hypothetical protein
MVILYRTTSPQEFYVSGKGTKTKDDESIADLPVLPPELETLAVYNALSADFEEDTIQRTSGATTGRGYDTTGIGYQFIANRLNEVIGIDKWSVGFAVIDTRERTLKSGSTNFDVTVSCIIDVNGTTRQMYGGHTSRFAFDAIKGAATNAFKKCAALFGVGKGAYEGTLDDDTPQAGDGTLAPAVATASRPAASGGGENKTTNFPTQSVAQKRQTAILMLTGILMRAANKPWGDMKAVAEVADQWAQKHCNLSFITREVDANALLEVGKQLREVVHGKDLDEYDKEVFKAAVSFVNEGGLDALSGISVPVTEPDVEDF